MAISKGQIQDNNGNILHPETDASMVISGSTTVDVKLLNIPTYVQASGSANTYTGSYTTTDSTYVEGRPYCVKINIDNTGASTLNLNSWGAKSILDATGAALTSGTLKTGIPYNMIYNGSAFILQAKGGGGGTVQGTETLVAGIKVLNNIAKNGSFENSACNWSIGGGVTSQMSINTSTYYKGNTSIYTNASGGTDGYYIQNPGIVASHIYYLCGWVYVSSFTSGDTTCIENGATTCTFDSAKLNQWQFLSNVGTSASSSPRNEIRVGHVYSNAAVWQGYIDAVTCIDLTAVYGSGSEPTLIQMNDIMTSLNGYLDGTALINKIPSGNYTTTGSTGSAEVIIQPSLSNVGSEPQVTAVKGLTNMITNNSSFESGTTGFGGVQYSSMGVNTTYHKFGSQSFSVTGSTSYTEACMTYQTNLTYTQGHKYYVSVWVLSDTAGKTSELYWPLVTPYPNGYLTCTAAGTWYRNAFISNNATIASGSYALRFDNNNNSTATTMYFDGVTCIDLTAAYGAGNEPSLAQMNTLMDSVGGWFQGSLVVESISPGMYTTPGTTGTTEVITASSDLLPSNILSGKNIMGVVGSIPNQSAYTNYVSLATDGSTLYTRIPQGAYLTNTSGGYPETKTPYPDIANFVGLDSNKMLNSLTALGVTGTIPNKTSAVNFGNSDSTAFTSSASMCNGIAYNSAVGAFDIYVPAGYYNGGGTNRIHIPNLLPSNIVNGVQVGWSGHYIQGSATVASLGGTTLMTGTSTPYVSSGCAYVDLSSIGHVPEILIGIPNNTFYYVYNGTTYYLRPSAQFIVIYNNGTQFASSLVGYDTVGGRYTSIFTGNIDYGSTFNVDMSKFPVLQNGSISSVSGTISWVAIG